MSGTRMTTNTEMAASQQGKVGLDFVHMLANGQYDAAHRMLASALRSEWPPAKLQATFEKMTMGCLVTSIDILECHGNRPGKPENEIGWVYVNLALRDSKDDLFIYNEAIAVTVHREGATALISVIQWGRP